MEGGGGGGREFLSSFVMSKILKHLLTDYTRSE